MKRARGLRHDAGEDIGADGGAAAIAENENMGAAVLLRCRGDIGLIPDPSRHGTARSRDAGRIRVKVAFG
jgi:hypothetical protein